MGADIIQVKYDELEAIARRFGQSAQAQVALEQRMRRGVQGLQDGGWEGRGSAAFYAEMSEKVFPAMQRLVDALRAAQKVTLQICQVFQAAEEDAARPFRGGKSGTDEVTSVPTASTSLVGSPADRRQGSSELPPPPTPPIQPQTYDPNESYRQAVGLGIDWFLNKPLRMREFGPDSSLTQDIIHDPGMAAFHKVWADAGYPLPFEWRHTRDERQEGSDFVRFVKAIPVYFREHVVKMALVSVGVRSQTPEGQLDAVGGTIGSLDKIRAYDVGNGMVTIVVYNQMNWKSLLRVPGSSESYAALEVPWTGQTIDYFLRHYVGGSTDLEQYFRWQEPRP